MLIIYKFEFVIVLIIFKSIYFQSFADILNQYELGSALFYRADQERSNLIMHETTAKSIVVEATNNLEKSRAAFEVQAQEFAQAKAMISEKAQEATTWMEQHGRILDALRGNLIPEINACIKLSGMMDALCLKSAVLAAGVPFTIVPEPTQVQCHDIDKEVSQLVAELDLGFSSALIALQAYTLALQRILPLNYLTTSAVHGWTQVLQLSANALSADILTLARRQAAELIVKARGNNLDSVKHSHDDLCLKVEKYGVEIENLEKEYFELVNSIGSETESKAKDVFMSTFFKFMKSAGLVTKEDARSCFGQLKYDGAKDDRMKEEQNKSENREKVSSLLNIAVSSIYDEVKHKTKDVFSDSTVGKKGNNRLQSDYGSIFCEFEEQVEKCILVAEFVNELCQILGADISEDDTDADYPKDNERNWASIFRTSLLACKSLVGKMTEVVLPEVLKSAISFNSEVMDAFGLISQIRGSIDTALEQLLEVEVKRASLAELEQNYFVRVGLITEQQLALEEAAMKGRDHLSWEEAEELASQEEACRAELNQLHQSWNQKDMQSSSLMKQEANIRSCLITSERHFQSAVSTGELRGEPHVLRSKVLLASLVNPFSELESVDKKLALSCGSVTSNPDGLPQLATLMTSGRTASECSWSFDKLNSHSFFIWKIGVVDSILDLCIHDVASSVDQNLGFDQLLNVVKKKVEVQLQEHISRYLKERVAPSLLVSLDKEIEHLRKSTELSKELVGDEIRQDSGIVTKAQAMLEEYCNAHETARAGRSAASLMKKQVNEFREVLNKTILEIFQMEWMHDVTLTPSYNSRITFQKFFPGDDNIYPVILNLSRPKLLETVQSAVSKIARSIEGLQACERTSLTAEEQLERAMKWACGGPNSNAAGNSSTKSSGIPPEFHDHLMRRQQLLWEAREKASDIVKICMSILEFEASRDGIFQIPREVYPLVATGDGRPWQQAYLNALTKLDVSYHSFTRKFVISLDI